MQPRVASGADSLDGWLSRGVGSWSKLESHRWPAKGRVCRRLGQPDADARRQDHRSRFAGARESHCAQSEWQDQQRRRPAHGFAPADYRVQHRHRAGSPALHSNYDERHGLYIQTRAGSFTGITYSADGTKLFFSQDDNHVVIANVNPDTGLSDQRAERGPARAAGGWPALLQREIHQPRRHRSLRGRQARLCGTECGQHARRHRPGRLSGQAHRPDSRRQCAEQRRRSTANMPTSATKAGARPPARISPTIPTARRSSSTGKMPSPSPAPYPSSTSTAGKEVKTIKVGLHPAGMTISGSNLYVANAYSDSLSVIDLNTGSVARTINLSVPINGGVFGSGPNGVAVTDDGRAYRHAGPSQCRCRHQPFRAVMPIR